MSEQVQHPLISLGIENLKTLLFNNEKRTVLLNKQHRLYLAVNEKAQTVAYRDKAYNVITFDIHGVRIKHFNYSGAILKKELIDTSLRSLIETYRKELQQYFATIVSEEWERKYSILTPILGDRAKQLQRPTPFTENCFGDPHRTNPITTPEERALIKNEGLEIFAWEIA